MADDRSNVPGLDRAVGETKKQAAEVAQEVSGAAQDLYDQAKESTSRVATSTKKAARNSAQAFERALRDTVENQPYTAVLIGVAVGWLVGRMHRPL
jgi:ElaB/YqjD/DUF883 family membrane-anchored ribosome-binding protein